MSIVSSIYYRCDICGKIFSPLEENCILNTAGFDFDRFFDICPTCAMSIRTVVLNEIERIQSNSYSKRADAKDLEDAIWPDEKP